MHRPLSIVVSLCLPGILAGPPNLQDRQTGHFWHVADMHWDPTYGAEQAGLSCNPGSPAHGPYGPYGDYRCDPPWTLIQSGFDAMKDIRPYVDFVLWTGDDTPHIWNDTILHQDWVFDIIANQTQIITESFNKTPVFSALGNHDWSPKNQIPPRPDPFYERLLDLWSPWLTTETAKSTFSKGGYYCAPLSDKLTVVVLNTNLFYDSNQLTEDLHDPANHLQWFDDVMTETAQSGKKAVVVGHIPPGMFEKHVSKYWFYPSYNEAFLSLLSKHAQHIGSLHFAHHHTDSFRLVRDMDGHAAAAMLLAPALSPWETTLPGVMGGAGNNPSVRLVEYNTDTGAIEDIQQYWLNLTEANELGEAQWKLEYTATEYYDIDDVSAQVLGTLAEKLVADSEVFDKYYKANGVNYDPDEVWDEDMRSVHYCAITELHYDDYASCYMERSGASGQQKTSLGILIFMALIATIQGVQV